MADQESPAEQTDTIARASQEARTSQEERLEKAVRQAEARSAEDHAALERIRRKLTRLMLVSLTVTFIALMVVAVTIIYKIAHTNTVVSKTVPIAQTEHIQNPTTAKTQREQRTKQSLSPIFIETAPNSGAEAAFAREKQQAEEEAKIHARTSVEQILPLKPGEILVSESLDGDLLLLRTAAPNIKQSGAKTTLVIYDFSKGKVRARINIESESGNSTN